MIAIFAGSSSAAYIRLTPNQCRVNIRTVLLDSTLQRMENAQNILFIQHKNQLTLSHTALR